MCSEKTRNQEYISQIANIDSEFSNNEDMTCEQLIENKYEVQCFLATTGISYDLLFQFVSIAIAIVILALSIFYYIYSDSLYTKGYNEYLGAKFEIFSELVREVIYINSNMLEFDYTEGMSNGESYIAMNTLMSEFTRKSNVEAFNIISNSERTNEFEEQFYSLTEKLANHENGEKYYELVMRNERLISDMNNLNKEYYINISKSEGAQIFLNVIVISVVILLAVITTLLFMSGTMNDIGSKNRSIAQYRLDKINHKLKAIAVEKPEAREYDVTVHIPGQPTAKKYNIRIS